VALRNALGWGALIVGALAITYTYAPTSGKLPVAAPDARKPAADFKLIDSDGKEVRLSDYKDKVVLLNFWATWCGPCEVEIPWFKEFERTYKDRGFAVLGVSSDEEGWAAVRPYMKAQAMNYRVLLDDGKLPSPYKEIEALPTTYVLDRQGRIAVSHTGLVAKNVYEGAIQQLLEN
jgi:cytochrome c biogenesis protein CcmG/thiol:disulfide interchange protein DsbE